MLFHMACYLCEIHSIHYLNFRFWNLHFMAWYTFGWKLYINCVVPLIELYSLFRGLFSLLALMAINYSKVENGKWKSGEFTWQPYILYNLKVYRKTWRSSNFEFIRCVVLIYGTYIFFNHLLGRSDVSISCSTW